MNKPNGGAHDDRISSEQLRTFRMLFVAREDAHAIWAGDKPQAIREPLTDDVLVSHLLGEYRVGTYLIKIDGRTPFLVFDVDIRSRQIVTKIVKRVRTMGMSTYVERSKSKGFHVWVFFDEPLLSAKARTLAKLVLRGLESRNIEIFPKQDEVKEDGLGNCIWLPLFGSDVSRDRTVFVDNKFKPIESQWACLESIRRTPTKIVIKLCRELGPTSNTSGTKRLEGPSGSDGGPIKERKRNSTLASLAGAMRRRGATYDAILAALREENQRRCEPPLDEKEVDAIAASISRYEPARMSGAYCVQDGHICAVRETKDGPVTTPLCNFKAHVTEEVALDDGVETTRAFVIEGQLDTGERLPATRVPATRYAGLNWVTENWGVQAIVNAGISKRDQLREAIQRLSPALTRRSIYTHTGWREIDGKWNFLTSAGGVGGQGVEVDLGKDLHRYRLPAIAENTCEAMRVSLRLLEIAPLTVTVALWAAMFRAPLAAALPVDFSLWFEGQTGSFKSTLAALFLSHFGDFDSKSLPGNWESTANQLEHRAFTLKDLPFVVDDYSPKPQHAFREMESKAARLLRAQGNLSGRGRLRADVTERPAHPPRGIILSTGEQHPPGQSLLARTLLVQCEKKIVDVPAMTQAQHGASRLSHAMAGYIAWLAPWIHAARPTLLQVFNEMRSQATGGGHLRIPEVLAHLYVGLYFGTLYAEVVGACSHTEAVKIRGDGWCALLTLGQAQMRAIDVERPTRRFLQVIFSLLNQNRVSLLRRTDPGYNSRTGIVGWCDDRFIYLLPEAAYEAVSRFCRDCGEVFPLRQERLARELHQDGLSDRDREHYTVVARLGGQLHRVIRLQRDKVEKFVGEPLPGGGRVTSVTGSHSYGAEALWKEIYGKARLPLEKKPVKTVTRRFPRIPLRFPRYRVEQSS